VVVGARASGKISQLLDRNFPLRRAAASNGGLGRLVARLVLVQHRASNAQGKKSYRQPSLRHRNLEGTAEVVSDRAAWKQLIEIYNRKYGGDLGPLLESSGSTIFRVTPQTVFGQDEHAENFAEAVTRWTFASS